MHSFPSSAPNADQIHYWNRQIGPKWVALSPLLDAQIAPLPWLAPFAPPWLPSSKRTASA